MMGIAMLDCMACNVRYKKARNPNSRVAPIAVSVGVLKKAPNGDSIPSISPVTLVTPKRMKRTTETEWKVGK